MVNLDILREYGCTSERLRQIFTCTDMENPDWAIKESIQDEVRSRVHEGVEWSARNANPYMAVDLAWDSQTVNKTTIPLQLYAQGKISMSECAGQLSQHGISDEFCERDETGEVKNVNVARLYEVSMNLVRSYTTRRVAAQVSRFNNLYPYFKYEPRSTALPAKLRGEALSQRVEIMVDQFGLRHNFTQYIRDLFLYGHSVVFPREAWTRDVQWRYARDEYGETKEIESFVTREGLDYFNPHPTRVFHDQSAPLAGLNTDTGPAWVGYWDVVRYDSIRDNSNYWNVGELGYESTLFGIYGQYAQFFNFYYDPTILNFPSSIIKSDALSPFQNERVSTSGLYSAEQADKGVFLTNIFMKINPRDRGVGNYPFDVWIRLVVASDDTIIYGEFLPSIPAVYGGLNENDSRVVNNSMAMEIMPYQDQLTNLLSQMLLNMKIGLTQIWAIDKDALDEETKEYIEKAMKAGDYYVNPKLLMFSGQRMTDMGIDTKNFINVIQADMKSNVNNSMQAINQLLGIVERMMVLSPQEVGQPAPREISATEVSEMATSVESIYSFVSEGVDEMRSGMKKMIYEHLVACSTSEFDVPVKNRYSSDTIKNAGFTPSDEDYDQAEPMARNVIGTPASLVHEYLFSSRDGPERSSNMKAAETLTQLMGQILQIPPIIEAVGKRRLFNLMNEIFRKSGAGFDMKLELEEGEDEAFAPPQEPGAQAQAGPPSPDQPSPEQPPPPPTMAPPPSPNQAPPQPAMQ